jgi:CRISPR-associated protein Cas5d
MKPYPIQLEISGPTALWTRPDADSSPVSYVAPTFSAVKGIFESVLRWKSVNVWPTKVEICAPVQFHRYATNYGGPLRAGDLVAKGARGPSFQLFSVVLVNVCYRLHAEADWNRGPHNAQAESPGLYLRSARVSGRIQSATRKRTVVLPALSRLERVCAGLRRAVPSRDVCVCEDENHELTTMLRMVFDQPQNGRCKPTFSRSLKVEKGVLTYA